MATPDPSQPRPSPLRALLAGLLALLGAATAAPAAAADPVVDGEQVLSAAEAAINVGEDRQAEQLIGRIPAASLAVPQIARAQIVRATIAMRRNQPMAALQALPSGSDHVPLYAERIEQLRAEALYRLGDPVAATRCLVLRERYLQSDAEALQDNRDLIWRSLSQMRVGSVDPQRASVQDEMTRGWLDLALAAQQGGPALAAWKNRHPAHPAGSRLPAIEKAVAMTPRGATPPGTGPAATAPSPRAGPALAAGVPLPATAATAAAPAPTYPSAATTRLDTSTALPPVPPPVPAPAATPAPFASTGGGGGVALLVPLTGPFAGTGLAVRDGLLRAAGAAAGYVRVYDSGASAEQGLAAYQSAINEGAGLIVGPLHREALAAIARLGTPPVPMLALNSLEDGAASPGNLLQFGLAPEDEARAAAEQATAQQRLRAIALVPRSDWGRRVHAAFADRLRELGGTLVAGDSFQSGTVDPSKMVKRLLGLDASEDRHKALTSVIGAQTEFDARRRSDLDFIFLAAKPSDSYLLLPQLRFFRAGNLPIYATSLIFDGRGIEWSGMRVCDMPWMLEANGPLVAARADAITRYPDSMRSYPRLVALGNDAWTLAQLVRDRRLQTETRIDGASGGLIVDASGRVRRTLGCSVPNSALSQALKAAPPPAPPPGSATPPAPAPVPQKP